MMEKGLAMGCVLDDGEGFGHGMCFGRWRMFHRGVCFERERIRGLGEIENFYEEESIYSHRRSVYIYI